jgi:ABC-2 type transport system permease protein
MSVRAVAGAQGGADRLRWQLRMIWMLARTEFKLRYTDSALGYFWTLARPLALFGIIYVVFARALKISAGEHYTIYLLIGIVLYTFFQDATSRTMSSIVDQSQLLRRLSFPRIIVPMSASVSALITFLLNLVAVSAFVVWERLAPGLEWLLVVPLLLELYIFVLALSLILATLFARLRDVGAIWELTSRVFFYASGTIFPLQVLPTWGQKLILLNPLTQTMQDIRALMLPGEEVLTAAEALGWVGRVVPLALTAALFIVGLRFFKRHESWFAEQA